VTNKPNGIGTWICKKADRNLKHQKK